ncbi:rta1 domain-containing protein [Ilyonectria robusta]
MKFIQSLSLIAFALGAAAAPSQLQERQEVTRADASIRCIAEGLIAGPASNQENFMDQNLCRDFYGCNGGLVGFTVAGTVLLGTCIDCPTSARGADFGGCLRVTDVVLLPLDHLVVESAMADDEFELYNYKPSSAAAMIFLLAFGLATLWHLWVIIRQRAWYFTPLLISCLRKYHGTDRRTGSISRSGIWDRSAPIVPSENEITGPRRSLPYGRRAIEALDSHDAYVRILAVGGGVADWDGDEHLFNVLILCQSSDNVSPCYLTYLMEELLGLVSCYLITKCSTVWEAREETE